MLAEAEAPPLSNFHYTLQSFQFTINVSSVRYPGLGECSKSKDKRKTRSVNGQQMPMLLFVIMAAQMEFLIGSLRDSLF